jgi:hypothetical protein
VQQLLPEARTTTREANRRGTEAESTSPSPPRLARRKAPAAAPLICRRRRLNKTGLVRPRSAPAHHHEGTEQAPAGDRLMPRPSTQPGGSPRTPLAPDSTAFRPFSPSPPRQARKRGQQGITTKSQQRIQITALLKETPGRNFWFPSDRRSDNEKPPNPEKPQIWPAKSGEPPRTTGKKPQHNTPRDLLCTERPSEPPLRRSPPASPAGAALVRPDSLGSTRSYCRRGERRSG